MPIMTFWAPGRCFSEEHRLAIRYTDDSVADRRVKDPTFPKEDKVGITWCNQCSAWHIQRLSQIHLVPTGTDL